MADASEKHKEMADTLLYRLNQVMLRDGAQLVLAEALADAEQRGRESMQLRWTSDRPSVVGAYWRRYMGKVDIYDIDAEDLVNWTYSQSEWSGPIAMPVEEGT